MLPQQGGSVPPASADADREGAQRQRTSSGERTAAPVTVTRWWQDPVQVRSGFQGVRFRVRG